MTSYAKPEIISLKSDFHISSLMQSGAFLFTADVTTASCCEQESSQGCDDTQHQSVLGSIHVSEGQICFSGLPIFLADCDNCVTIDDNGNFAINKTFQDLECINDGHCTSGADSPACCFRAPSFTFTGNFDGSHLHATLEKFETSGNGDPDCGGDSGCHEILILTADPA